MKEYKIGMVAAEFNFEVTSLMIERAKAEADQAAADAAAAKADAEEAGITAEDGVH